MDMPSGTLPVAARLVAAALQVPLFQTAVVDGQRTVTGLEPVFTSRLNPGNSLLVLIEVQLRINKI